MLFEWDDAKRNKNIDSHGLDFVDMDVIFGGPLIVGLAKTVAGESRLIATGLLAEVYVTAIYTMRGDVIRVISYGGREMGNEGGIKTYTAADLEAQRARGGSRTDLARVRAKSETDLERDVAGDPDFRDVPDDWYAAAAALMPAPKKLLSLRLDTQVIDWFKGQGPGYQTRMNAVLRAYIERSGKTRQSGPGQE